MTVNQGCFLFVCDRGPIYDVYIGGKVSYLIWAKYVTRINLWIDYVYLSLHIKGSLNQQLSVLSTVLKNIRTKVGAASCGEGGGETDNNSFCFSSRSLLRSQKI